MTKIAVFLEPEDWKLVMGRLRRGGEGETALKVITDLETQVNQAQSQDYKSSGAWLSEEEQKKVVEHWNTPKTHEYDNPRVKAIELIRETAKKHGWKLGLLESTKIKDNVLARVTALEKPE